MLKYFNSGYFSRTLMLIFLAALLWLPAFLLPEKMTVPEHPAPFYQFFLFLFGNNSYFHLSIAFTITVVSGILLNQIATQFGFTNRNAQLGTMVYYLLSAALVSYTTTNSFVTVNLLMLFFLHFLFKISDAKEPVSLSFNASFIIGITALFYLPALLFYLLLWFALLVFRISQWRNYAVSLIGLLIPFVFTFTWYFWNDQMQEASLLILSLFDFRLPDITNYSAGDLSISVILLIFTLVAVSKLSKSLMEKNINIRHILRITMYYLAAAFMLFLFFSESGANSLLLSIPASLLIAAVFSESKNPKWFERAIRLLLVLVFINQYIRFFYAA